MSIIGTVYEDVTSEVLGKIGPWQLIVTFLLTTLTVPVMFNQYKDMVLLKPSPDIYCIPPDNGIVLNTSLCYLKIERNTTVIESCEKWHIKFFWLIWIKKNWMVFCDHKNELLSISIISRIGLVFGFIMYGVIADSFGRKKALTFGLFAMIALRLIITFCNKQGWLKLFVFIRELMGSGSTFVTSVIMCEIASNKWRSVLSTIVMTPKLLIMVCAVPMANNTPNLCTFEFISFIYCTFCILAVRVIPDSPQWMLFNRKTILAQKTIFKAAKKNGITLINDFKIRPVNQRAYYCLEKSRRCLGIVTTKNVRFLTMILISIWMLENYLWFLLYLKVYGEKDYQILPILLFLLLFGCLNSFVARKSKLRILLIGNILFTGAFSSAFIYLDPKNKTIIAVLSSLALASGVVRHALILNMTPRLFATQLRATLFGWCHAAGQLGAVLCYLTMYLTPVTNVSMVAVQLLLTLALVALCFLIPDVDERELPDVLEDMDYFSELSKPLRWVSQKTSSPSLEEIEMRIYSFSSANRNGSLSQSDDRINPRSIKQNFLRQWFRLICWIRKITEK